MKKKAAFAFVAVAAVAAVVLLVTRNSGEPDGGSAAMSTTTTVILPPEPIVLESGDCYLAYRNAVDRFNLSLTDGFYVENGIFNERSLLDNAAAGIDGLTAGCGTQLDDGATQFLVEANRLAAEAASLSPVTPAYVALGITCRKNTVETETIALICSEAELREAEYIARIPVDGFMFPDESGLSLPEGHPGSSGLPQP